MIDTPPTSAPLSGGRPGPAAADLVSVLREVRPQVLIQYNENGG